MKRCFKDISSALDYEFNYKVDTQKLAKSSQDALSYGYLKLLYSEVNSYKLSVVLTGGDAYLLKKLFVDAQINELLIFDGMKKLMN
jgi:type III pantothenate kinase